MRTISLPVGVAVFAFLALAGLMGLFAFSSAAPAWAQDDMTVSHAENDEGAVATFTAEDPEGITPVTWAIAASDADFTDVAGIADADNTDRDHFDIDKDGMLKFSIGTDEDPPDFEAPRGTGPATDTNTNTYKVVVAASDMETGGMTGYHKVTVMVTDVAEKGKATWTTASDGTNVDDPKLMQFHVGTLLTASATDGDIAGTAKAVTSPTWRWYRGSSPISGETGDTYTVSTADVGNRIRVVATYLVGDSTTQETASLTSDYPVLAVRAGDNKLKFEPSAVTREVDEGKRARWSAPR